MPYDLLTPSGIKVEVKAAGYVQAWPQPRPSTPRFTVSPAYGYDADTGERDAEQRCHADVYVFALHAHRDRATADPLDVDQWQFFVLPRSVVESGAATYTLGRLAAIGIKAVGYSDLAGAVRAVAP